MFEKKHMKQVGAFLLITLSLLTLSCTKSGVDGVARTDSIPHLANPLMCNLFLIFASND